MMLEPLVTAAEPPRNKWQTHTTRSAVELLDDDGHQVATIYATRAGLHITCGPLYELDGAGLAIEVQQPTGLQVAFTRR